LADRKTASLGRGLPGGASGDKQRKKKNEGQTSQNRDWARNPSKRKKKKRTGTRERR